MMKMLVILLTAACLHLSAKGFTQTVTLSLKAVSMETAFREIEKQTGFSFIYGKEQVINSKPVNLNVKNEKLETVLDLLFKEQPLTYSISGKYIAIRKKDESSRTIIDQPVPPIDIKGRIVDEEGRPVVAASVQVKGIPKGTTTDDNGVFILKGIEPNTTLIISGANIQSFEWNVNGKTDLGDIGAKIKVVQGQEVKIEVSTGYQKVSKERFTGSYEQMDSAAFHRRAGMGILERLDGTVTGLFIDKKSSSQARYNIQVRGISTLNGSFPLVIVDNFEYPLELSNLNPNDIESITILKDAAAASIWGARAGNGVIVITTKKGRFNQPLQVAVRSNITITNKPDQYYYPQMS
ncbi:MAG TPA: secretin and TonB N-terminal domain-containing protein, partial [Chitinophagaceae bacterium]|nr:secretin and TonB N-terminal domain-containing protein [Chitinophagaceae bacterium]